MISTFEHIDRDNTLKDFFDSYNELLDILGITDLPFDEAAIDLVQVRSVNGLSGDVVLDLEPPLSIETASFTATEGNKYFIDNTAPAITVTMPTTPTLNDVVYFIGANQGNSWFIDTGAVLIQGIVGPLEIDVDWASFALRYINATYGWVIE